MEKNISKNRLQCVYCNNEFSNKQNLNTHQHKAKYCLKIQGQESQNKDKYICIYCNKKFSMKHHLKNHTKICIENKGKIYSLEKKIIELQSKLEFEIKSNNAKDDQILRLEEQVKLERELANNLACTLAKRPTTQNNTRNVQINNIVQNLTPLKFEDMKKYTDNLTLEYHKKGEIGYGQFAIDGPLGGKICCTDQSRGIYKYIDEDGVLQIDSGLETVFEAFCDAYKLKAYKLAQDHYQKLAEEFTEKEMEDCPTMDWAIALARYKFDKDNAFCKGVINFIKRKCNNSIIKQKPTSQITN